MTHQLDSIALDAVVREVWSPVTDARLWTHDWTVFAQRGGLIVAAQFRLRDESSLTQIASELDLLVHGLLAALTRQRIDCWLGLETA